MRGATPNRYIRGRLLVSALMFGAYAGLAAEITYGTIDPYLRTQLAQAAPLLVALGVITLAVSVGLNPWRADHVSDRFPHILQDTIIVALFAVAATVVEREKVLTTTAVGAVVIGFALQDTLGNLFAGLAIQIEKPFRVGDWVHVGSHDGLVAEITWRATKLRTKAGNFVIVPNSVISKDTITNFSQPTPETRYEVDVGASYDTPPNEVKAAILDALRDEPLVAAREPKVYIWEFAASSINYRVHVWSTDYALDDRVRDRVRSAIYYMFRRRNITIPYPIHTELRRELPPAAEPDVRPASAALAAAGIFAPLTPEQLEALRGGARVVLYSAGEPIVRQGAAGDSMFIVARGQAIVTVEPGGEVARVAPGGFFGEMSLLTGAPRTATVRAATDCEVIEITADGFRTFVLSQPAVLERITHIVATRRDELARHAAAGHEQPHADESPASFLDRVRRFLRLAPL